MASTGFNIKGLSFSANLAEIVCKDLNGNLYQLKDLDPTKEYTVTVYKYTKTEDDEDTTFLRQYCGKVTGVSKEIAVEMRKQLNTDGFSDYTLLFKGESWLGEPTAKAKDKGAAKQVATEEIPF